MWNNGRSDSMPPKEFFMLAVKGQKTFMVTPTCPVTVSFYALIDNCSEYALYHPSWRGSLTKASIYDVCPRLELAGEDIRTYNVHAYVIPDDWFFTLYDVDEWFALPNNWEEDDDED